MVRLLCQILCTDRRLVYLLLARDPHLIVSFRLVDRLRG
jgi:hypothetical protein